MGTLEQSGRTITIKADITISVVVAKKDIVFKTELDGSVEVLKRRHGTCRIVGVAEEHDLRALKNVRWNGFKIC